MRGIRCMMRRPIGDEGHMHMGTHATTHNHGAHTRRRAGCRSESDIPLAELSSSGAANPAGRLIPMGALRTLFQYAYLSRGCAPRSARSSAAASAARSAAAWGSRLERSSALPSELPLATPIRLATPTCTPGSDGMGKPGASCLGCEMQHTARLRESTRIIKLSLFEHYTYTPLSWSRSPPSRRPDQRAGRAQGRAQSRCRRGRGESCPGASSEAGVSRVPVQTVRQG